MRRAPRGPSFKDVRDQARALLDELERGHVAGLYLLSGTDDYQRQAIVRRVVGQLVPETERDMRLTVLDGGQVTARAVAAELESSGFRFGDEPRRVVLVRDAPWFRAGAGDEAELLRQRLEAGLLDDVTVIFDVRGAVDRRLNLTKLVLERGVHLDFPALADEQDIDNFLRGRLRRARKTMPRDALAELITRRGTESQVLTQELEKLIAYVGERSEIDLDDVRAMVAPTAELSVFDLVDAVAERRTSAALQQLEGLLEQRAEPFLILALLSRQFRLLLQARWLLDSGAVAPRLLKLRPFDFNQELTARRDGVSLLDDWRQRGAGVIPTEGKQSLLTQHYFPLWKALTVAGRLDTTSLEGALERLLQADLGLKSSHLEPRQELELLVVDLCTRMDCGATVALETILDG